MDRLREQLRRRRAAALRPGQVVSGRAAAALVAQPLLAPRRRADLDTIRRCSRASATTTARPRRRRASSCIALARCGSASIRRNVFAGLRRRRLLPLARAQAADQRRSDRFAPRRPAERERLRQVFEQRPRQAGRPRAADRAPTSACRPLALDGPGSCATTAASWSPAIRRWATGCRSIRSRGRVPNDMPWIYPPDADDDCRLFPAGDARAGRRPGMATRRRLGAGARRRHGSRAARTTRGRRRRRRSVEGHARDAPRVTRVGRLRRSHRDQRRGARRSPLRLHAADRGARGLPRARRRGRGHGRRDASCRCRSKATSRRRTRASRRCASRPTPA